MSTTIDERVVSMQFDNRNFETNAKTTMSTLDKLKQKLNLSGAAKGLSDVDAAAKKVDLSSISKSADTVGLRFNAMYTVADQALRNMTNSAMQAGKNILSALTIDPVKTGLSEYETKINAIQVIKANTRDKYDDEVQQMADIEQALSDLNDYADRTIYNYTQMTSNVGKFVAQGLGVTEATKAVQGLANLAGASGASAEDMARATYQMSQALGGTIRKIDWNSLRNANMATVQLKNTLMDIARVEGIDIDAMIEEKGTFEDTLEKGWLTGQMFTEAMNIYSDVYSEAELKAKGFNDEQIKNFKDLAKTAAEATTEVKTISQLWDVLKETAQSGWTQTWELIIGDFDTAKKMLTDLQNYFSNIINGWSNARNWIVEGVLNFTKPWTVIMEKLDGAGLGGIAEMVDTIEGAMGTLENWQKIVNDVWRGDYNNRGDNPDRYDLLTAAGWNPRVVQDLVNKGYQYKLTIEDVEASHKKFGVTMDKTADATEDSAESIDMMTFALENLSDEQLEQVGLTKDEIKLFRDIAEEAKRTGISFDEMVEKMSTVTGRTLLVESLKNAWSGVLGIAQALSGAFEEIFPTPSIPRIYTMIEALNAFSENLRLTDKETGELTDTAKQLKRIFKGVFAAIDIVATILGGALRMAFKLVCQVLDYFGVGVLEVVATVGDAIVGFRDWFDALLNIDGIIEALAPHIVNAATAISGWVSSIKSSKEFIAFTDRIKGISEAFRTWIEGMKNADNLPKYIAEGIGKAIGTLLKSVKDIFGKIRTFVTGGFKDLPGFMTDGFVGGLWDGIKKVGQSMLEFGTTILEKVKEVLGIHSPSTEMAEVGRFTIEGFIQGVGDALSGVWEILKTFGTGVVNFVKNIDFGKIFALAGSVGIVSFAYSLSKAVSAFGSVLWNLGDIMDNTAELINTFKKSINRMGKAVANSLNAMAFKQLAISIAILVGSIVVLTLLDPGKMWAAVGVIAALAGIMAALFVVVNKLGSSKNPLAKKTTVIDFGKMAMGILAIAGAIMIMAIAARMIGNMDTATLTRAGIGLTILAGVLVGLMAATKLIAKTGGSQITSYAYNSGKMLMQMAAAILVLVVAAKLIASMSWDEMAKAGTGLIVLAGIMVGLMAATKLIAKTKNGSINAGIEKTGKMLMQIAGAILLLVIAAKLIAGMDWADMGKAAVGLLFLGGIMVGLMAATQLITKTTKGNISTGIEHTGKMLLSIAAAMLVLVIAAKMIAGMSWGEMAKAGVGLAALGGIVVGLMAATKLAAGGDLKGVAVTILAMSIAIGVMAAAAVLLSVIDAGALAKGVIAIAALAGAMTLMVKSTKGAQDCKGNLIAMTVAIGVMAGAIALLSFIDPTSLATATVALGAVMGMFALMTSQAGKAAGALGPLITMTVAIGVMAGALYLLAGLPVEGTIGSAVALSTMILAMSVALNLLTGVGKMGKDALIGVVALLAMAVPLLAFVGILALMQGVQNAMTNVMALTVLATALTALLIPLTIVGLIAMASGGMSLLGIAALLAMAVPLLAFVGILAIMQNIQNATANTMLLITMMGCLTDMLFKISIVAPLAVIAVGAISAMIGLVTILGVLAVGIGALMDKFPQLQTFLDTGLPILEQLAGSLGTMLGNFVSGFIGGIADTLPDLGMKLGLFMTNAMPFIVGAKLVDEKVLAGVGVLAGAVVALTAADLMSGVASFLQGGASFADLGTQLSLFMVNAMPFIMAASTIDPAAMEGVKTLAETILILTARDIMDGLTSWFTGGASLADFGAELAPFGAHLKAFADSVAGIDGESVKAAAEAGKILAEMASTVPNEGGVVGWFAGENSLAAFGEEIASFGPHIKAFADSVVGINGEAVKAACEAATAITDMADTVPNEGGVAGWFAGENSLAAFGEQIASFGGHLKTFSDNVVGINGEAIKTACDAATAITAMADTIPNEGGVVGWFAGENSLAAFGDKIADFGSDLKTFSDNVVGLNSAAVRTATSAATTLVDMTAAIPKKIQLKDYGKQLVSFGEKLVDFVEDVSTVDSEMLVVLTSNLESMMDKLAGIGEVGVSGFVKAFTDGKKDVKTATTDLVNAAVNNIKTLTKYNNFKSAGKYLVDGFAAGITDRTWKAAAKAAAMASAAYEAAKEALDVNSPSKVFRALGTSVPEGFAMGIDKLGGVVRDSATSMAGTAIDGTKSAIARISDAISSGVDAQPTIRPVLDLSDVTAGARSIGGLFDSPRLAMANVGAISSMMSTRGQNGSNADIVSAIDKLNKKMDNVGNTTYQINGVTYDDGSNISDAVATLVRAARIERRV